MHRIHGTELVTFAGHLVNLNEPGFNSVMIVAQYCSKLKILRRD